MGEEHGGMNPNKWPISPKKIDEAGLADFSKRALIREFRVSACAFRFDTPDAKLVPHNEYGGSDPEERDCHPPYNRLWVRMPLDDTRGINQHSNSHDQTK